MDCLQAARKGPRLRRNLSRSTALQKEKECLSLFKLPTTLLCTKIRPKLTWLSLLSKALWRYLPSCCAPTWSLLRLRSESLIFKGPLRRRQPKNFARRGASQTYLRPLIHSPFRASLQSTSLSRFSGSECQTWVKIWTPLALRKDRSAILTQRKTNKPRSSILKMTTQTVKTS